MSRRPKEIQCEASPIDGAKHTLETCLGRPPVLHVWKRDSNRDAIECINCGLTFLGGPTQTMTPEEVAAWRASQEFPS